MSPISKIEKVLHIEKDIEKIEKVQLCPLSARLQILKVLHIEKDSACFIPQIPYQQDSLKVLQILEVLQILVPEREKDVAHLISSPPISKILPNLANS
ncbi:hypothetical protein AMTR_s00027p00224970 [Amborella trichopoda]|uniref:Uncharacterized protein n=1 Tax=Amborella trichopoda TaxID=13333 RepID=W1PRY4_AMBTC|nr:hypothetical protein AMTR_s00027p00224970 [Amborella trichopoda]